MNDSPRNILRDLDNTSGVLTLTFNRPDKLNALNIATLNDLGAAITAASNDDHVRAILLTGSGQKAFMAGADIGEFMAVGASGAREFATRGQHVLALIENCSKPVLAAVNGFALGGGCEVAMACHLRVAAENARFGQPEVNLGIIPGYGGTQRLAQLVGKGKAIELILTGDQLSATEALQLGLVNHVVPQSDLLTFCHALLQRIVKKAPVAVSQAIRSVNAYYETAAFSEEINAFTTCCETEDFVEGVTAFLEKRAPVFKGL